MLPAASSFESQAATGAKNVPPRETITDRMQKIMLGGQVDSFGT